MSLEKITNLHSIEILSTGAINVRWDTSITENGEIISGPSIHRRAFSPEELLDLVAPIDTLLTKFKDIPQ